MNEDELKNEQDKRCSEAYVKNLARVGAKYASPLHEKQQDMLKAFQFYSQAAQYGHAGSNYELGVMYASGVASAGVEEDHVKAAEYFRKAAESGMAGAHFNLGLMYEAGRGVKKDTAKAIAAWETAALSRHPKALATLGEKYFLGNEEVDGETRGAVNQDFGKALKFWGMAAECDNPKAILSLAVMYENGLGVAQSSKRASELYDLAAFCWVQQQQPPPGQENRNDGSKKRVDKLPRWFKMGNGKFPDYRERNFVGIKRPVPVLGDFTASALGPGVHRGGANTSPIRARPGSPAAAVEAPTSAESRALAADTAAAAAAFSRESGLSPRTVSRLLAKVEGRREAKAEVRSIFVHNYSDYLSLPHKDKKLKLNMTKTPIVQERRNAVLAPGPVFSRAPGPVFSRNEAGHRTSSSTATADGVRSGSPVKQSEVSEVVTQQQGDPAPVNNLVENNNARRKPIKAAQALGNSKPRPSGSERLKPLVKISGTANEGRERRMGKNIEVLSSMETTKRPSSGSKDKGLVARDNPASGAASLSVV